MGRRVFVLFVIVLLVVTAFVATVSSAEENDPIDEPSTFMLLTGSTDWQAELSPPDPLQPPISRPTDVFTTGTYVTAPYDFPIFEFEASNSGIAPGYLFLTLFNANDFREMVYQLILDNHGEPVYYKRTRLVGDFKVQKNGLLTYFDPGAAPPQHFALDNTYTVVDTYEAGNGYIADAHDFLILENGHNIVLIHDTRIVDMSVIVPGGDPEAAVIGCIVQEIDTSDNVVFEWSSWDYIPFTDSYWDLTASVIPYIHCNSVDSDNDGNILLGSRNLQELTKIDRQTGDIIWRLGGKANQFTFTNDQGFFFQHDASWLPNGNVGVFDNRTATLPIYSRAVEYEIDEQNLTATRVWEYRNTPDTYGPFLGSFRLLPNGNRLVGWGASNKPVLTEVMPGGNEVFELSSEPNRVSYRSFRYPWEGYPTWPPVLIARQEGPSVKLYFSWNGATDVGSYEVYGNTGNEPTTFLSLTPKDGFETSYEFQPSGDGLYTFKVRALDNLFNPTMYSNTAYVMVGGTPMYLPFAYSNGN